MLRLSAIVLLLCAATLVPAVADTVYLTNGRHFEDVVAEVGETEVTLRMPFGILRLSRDQVDRVEESDSGLEEYLERVAELRRQAGADAEEWLKLAGWARSQGLEHGVREAALTAAALDPGLTGLEPLMRSLGYVMDDEMGLWTPFDEFMRRRGFVESDGVWISREELADRRRTAEAEAEVARARREADRAAADRAELDIYRQLMLQAALTPTYQPPPSYGFVGWVGGYYPPVVRPPIHPLPPGHGLLPGRPGASVVISSPAAVVGSQPGSLLPIAPAHHGSTTTVR